MTALTRKMLASRAARFLRFRHLNIARRFVRKNDGAAAVEFGLVAAPFLALVFAIIETAAIFFAGQVLETAAADSGRLIMTGQFKGLGITDGAGFKTEVCKRIFGLFDCSKIQVDVRKYSSLSSADLSKPIDPKTGELKTTLGYDQTAAGDLVVVRLVYEWPVYVSLLGLNLADMASNKRLIMATSAFRNEPFGP
jgi:Flp pilus assembly protein TadG